jgi:hypothetical protein
LLKPENGLISQILEQEHMMDKDNHQELFSVRLKALECRLKEIDEKVGKRT